MSILNRSAHAGPKRHPGTFLKMTYVFLLIILAGGLFLAVPLSAQSTDESNGNRGSILGTVTDIDDAPIPDATVVLQGPTADDRHTLATKDDGVFSFQDVTPGIPYQITVTSAGFSEWDSSVTLELGQKKSLTDVKLRIEGKQRTVIVAYSPQEIVKQQLKAEEKQRILGFIPNLYVTYEPHPEPLTTEMKFHLAYKSLTDPVFWGWLATWSGIQQAANTPNYPQGAEGYFKRFGANSASGVSEGLIGNAILPSLLHQDPRYFYQGNGTKKSRAWHALSASFVCKGDNGRSQPNYSTWGGSLISNAIAVSYLPGSNRTADHVFGSFGIGMATHVVSSLAQEFILARFTSKGNR